MDQRHASSGLPITGTMPTSRLRLHPSGSTASSVGSAAIGTPVGRDGDDELRWSIMAANFAGHSPA